MPEMAPEERVAVVGAGPAGLAAALALSDAGRRVVLLERAELGGQPAAYACVATDRCANCSSCLALGARREVLGCEAIELAPSGAEVRLEAGVLTLFAGGEARPLAGAIVATGFRPADPRQARPELGLGRVPGVSTVPEIEARLRSGALAERPPARLAFVQCVGSRDRAIGRDWCSRACCTYALRLARAIHHRLPDVAITIFYQDLTPSAAGFAELVEECRGFVRFVRALPAKVWGEPGGDRPVVSYVDTLAGPDAPQVEEAFDEVALSVGVWPREDAALDAGLELRRDDQGFLVDSGHSSVLVAGACTGPMTISEATASGRAAARRLLAQLEPTEPPAVALIDADEATLAAITARGFRAIATSRINGVAGSFTAVTEEGEVPVRGALEAVLTPKVGEEAGLPPHVRSLWSARARDRALQASHVVLMPDLFAPFSRCAHELALRIAAARSSPKLRTHYLMRHAFTGEAGLEQLLTQAREAGAIFTVCAEPPTVEAEAVAFADPTLGRSHRVKADIVLAAPAPSTASACEGTENPHFGLSRSPRVGVHLAGFGCDDTASEEQVSRSLEEALTDIAMPVVRKTAEVDPELCAICWTCFRVCPHKVPVRTPYPERARCVSVIQPEACTGCGVCVSACPAEAIRLIEEDASIVALEASDG